MRGILKIAVVLVAPTFLTLAGGCKKSGTSSAATPIAGYSRIDPTTAGAIEGTVHFDQAAPARVEIDMAQDPACSMTGGTNLSEGVIVNAGRLANVFVSVTNGLGDKVYPASTAPVVLDQKGCRYLPHVIAAQVGQPVDFRNSDPTMHNVHMEPAFGGNQAVDISQPPNSGGAYTGNVQRAFARPENMIPVRCNNHPWMEAFINVAPNPFFAVTDANGHFAIHGLPPGTYTLTAVQEQLGTQQTSVTVSTHGMAGVEFHFNKTGSK